MSSGVAFARRVSAVREALWEVRPRTQQQWLNELDRHADPEARLVAWEIVTSAYTAFFEAGTPTAKARDQALRVLLDCDIGLSEATIHKVGYKSLSIAEIKNLIAHYEAAAQTVREIAQLKRVTGRRGS